MVCLFPFTTIYQPTPDIRTSFFLVGFYTLSLVCIVLILKFGVLPAVNPPNATIRGMFVLASTVAGIAGGAITIFFWKATRYFIGGWGGFAFALWIQCFRNGGLISPIGFRWIMYIGEYIYLRDVSQGFKSILTFFRCCCSWLCVMHDPEDPLPCFAHLDCDGGSDILHPRHRLLHDRQFERGTLRLCLCSRIDSRLTTLQFYVWNIGFTGLFPRFVANNIHFPVTQVMQIELGLMGAVTLMGMAVQFQILKILQRKLKEIKEEQKRLDQLAVSRAAERFASLDVEKEEWERAHPSLAKHGRNDSGMTATTLMKDTEAGTDEKRASVFTLVGSPRQRQQSGLSEFMASPAPAEEIMRAARQSPGVLPLLDLGADIESDVPKGYIAEASGSKPRAKQQVTTAELEDLKKKEELLAEIQAARRSIELLKSETPAPSSSGESRHPSLTSRYDLGTLTAGPSHLRPPRQQDPRVRAQSMDFTRLADIGSTLGRPNSTPLRDEDWDSYVRDRKLLQPPSGVTAPIPTTPVSPTTRAAVSPAVAEALDERRRRESSLSFGGLNVPSAQPSPVPREFSTTPKEASSDENAVITAPALHKKSQSQGAVPVMILPRKKPIAAPTPKRPEQPRTKTFEELAERHREKMRAMQAPLTQAEKEQVELEEAKKRWERNKELEKRAMAKRQAEQAALSKEAKKKEQKSSSGSPSSPQAPRPKQHSRTLSADILAAVPNATASSRRMSTMKVDEWQKHQLADVELGVRPGEPTSSSKRRSAVPFPAEPTSSRDRRRTSNMPQSQIS